MSHCVLLVDDDPNVRNGLKRALYKERYLVATAPDAATAFTVLHLQHVDVVVSDQQMPGLLGTEFLAKVRVRYPDTIRMMLTGQASLAVAIAAINEGAIFRFFTKPCNPVDLAVTIRQALEQKDLLQKSWRLLETVREQAAVLERLEEEQPGITRLKQDAQGNLLIAESPPADREALLAEIQKEIARAQVRLR